MVEVVELSITPTGGYPGVYKVDISGSGFVPNQTGVLAITGRGPGV